MTVNMVRSFLNRSTHPLEKTVDKVRLIWIPGLLVFIVKNSFSSKTRQIVIFNKKNK